MTKNRAMARSVALLVAGATILAASAAWWRWERPISITAWAGDFYHGYRTDWVNVAFDPLPMNGQYVLSFRFPRAFYYCNDPAFHRFMGSNGAKWSRGCGYPGAEMFVEFSGVTDDKTAEQKLTDILPPLSRLAATFPPPFH